MPPGASLCRCRNKMAPVLEKKLLGAAGAGDTMENSTEDEEGQNLWLVFELLWLKIVASLCWKINV